MFIVWALLGALVAWPALGMSIGVAASLRRGFPVAFGIVNGFLMGPLAYLLFYRIAGDSIDPSRTIVHDNSPFVRRYCPECTGPNASLSYRGTTSNTASKGTEGAFVLWFVPPGHTHDAFTHRYKCIVCGYEWQFESPHVDPDTPTTREL